MATSQVIKEMSLKDYVCVALLSTFFWSLTILALDYLIVAKLFLVYQLPKYLLLSVLLLVSVILLFFYKRFFILKMTKPLPIILLITIGVLLTQGLIQKPINQLKEVPRIKSLSKDWSIHGDKIKITGRSFGFSPGKVYVDTIEYIPVSWSNKEIIVQQPVPNKYFKSLLIVCNNENKCSTGVPFTIKDPASVL